MIKFYFYIWWFFWQINPLILLIFIYIFKTFRLILCEIGQIIFLVRGPKLYRGLFFKYRTISLFILFILFSSSSINENREISLKGASLIFIFLSFLIIKHHRLWNNIPSFIQRKTNCLNGIISWRKEFLIKKCL